MLKVIALGIAAAVGLSASAFALPLRPTAPEAGAPVLLVKNDKGEHGNGRKLGHFKHHGDDEEGDDNGSYSWSSSRTYYVPVPVYPPAYYEPPAYYGNSLPPPYYGPPPY